MSKVKAFLAVLTICISNFLGLNAFSATKDDSDFSFYTLYNPTTHYFISDLTEILSILYELGFDQIGVETGEWTTLCQMAGCDCVRIYTYRKGDIIIKLYIDEIMDPHGEWISTDIMFKSKAMEEKFLNEAILMGFRAGQPVEGSVDYSRKHKDGFVYGFESGARYGVIERDDIWPCIQLGGGDDDFIRDAKIFRLTPEVRVKLIQYDIIDLFSYGLARVCKAGKWGFIDLKGNEVIPCVYDTEVGRFSEGLAQVMLDYDLKYDAVRVKFIDSMGRDLISGNYFVLRRGNCTDCYFEGLEVFYDGDPIWVRAKDAYPNGNYEDNKLLPVMINKKGDIVFIDDDEEFLDENYHTGKYEINSYPYGYLTPIEKAYENEALTGSPYYIGRDTIPGGNGTSLVSLYLVDLTQPRLMQLVEEVRGIMDYKGSSTISQTNKVNFERRAMVYISRRTREKNKGTRVC